MLIGSSPGGSTLTIFRIGATVNGFRRVGYVDSTIHACKCPSPLTLNGRLTIQRESALHRTLSASIDTPSYNRAAVGVRITNLKSKFLYCVTAHVTTFVPSLIAECMTTTTTVMVSPDCHMPCFKLASLSSCMATRFKC